MKHDAVQTYYGETLQGSSDLQTNACCTPGDMPAHLKAVLSKLHDEVLTRYYGCGLIAPQAARLVLGQFRSGYLAGTALMGGGLVLVADTLGRMMIPPHEIPAGAVTALLGTPLFLLLLVRRHHVTQ